MDVQRMAPIMVVGLTLALVAAALVTLATGEAPAPADAGYETRRICVDDDTNQPSYLDGDELAGDAFTASDFGFASGRNIAQFSVSDIGDDNEYRYYFNITGGRIRVSSAGASQLEAGKVYPVRLTATDDGDPPASATLDVGVWLDAATLSQGDNGLC